MRKGVGTYACSDHPEERVTLFIEPKAVNCGRCGKKMEKVADLSAEDIKEQRAEERRAAREEAKLKARGL